MWEQMNLVIFKMFSLKFAVNKMYHRYQSSECGRMCGILISINVRKGRRPTLIDVILVIMKIFFCLLLLQIFGLILFSVR